MKLLDVLSACGNYNNYVQIHDCVSKKTTGIMKAGNVPYKTIDRLKKRDVLSLVPCNRKNQNYLFIQLVKGGDEI